LRLSILALTTMIASPALASPNILLIIADDMGVDVSPCYSETPQANMPNLKELCDNGMVFENAYSAPLCSPTRATVMTGKYGFRTGVGSVPSREHGGSLSEHETTVFDRIKDKGYSTALIGKWHLSADPRDLNHPQKLGVDHFFGPFGGGVKDYENWAAVENGRRVRVSNYATSEISDRAIDWLGSQSSPWFLWLAYNAPHTPFHLPPTDLHNFDDLSGNDRDLKRNPAPYYYAALEALDAELGRALDSLSADERHDTVVFFIGDNGTPTQLLGRDNQGRGKGSLYEGGVNVPLIVSGTSVSAGRSEALVNTTDLFSTILTLADADPTAEDSISFVPALAGAAGDRQFAYVEHFAESPPRGGAQLGWAIRDARYKLIKFDDQPAALFDLLRDPGEQRNLLQISSTKHEEIAASLIEAKSQITQ